MLKSRHNNNVTAFLVDKKKMQNAARIFSVIIGCVCFITSVNAQKLTYRIFLNKDTIGILNAERQAQKESVSYILQSKMTVHKIINVDVEYKMESDYSNGKMMHSTAYQKINKRVQVNSSTKWDGTKYVIETADQTTTLKNKNIHYNMCAIYYFEPVGITQVYSDAFGKFLNIRPVSSHRYELTLPDGKRSYYNYASGICFQVESEQLFSKVIFRLTR